MNLKKSDKHIERILISLERGATLRASCDAAHITPATFWNWRKKDPELADKVEQIEQSNIAMVEDALFSTAIGGAVISRKTKLKQGKVVEVQETFAAPNVAAQCFFLSNRKSDKWKNNRDHFIIAKDEHLKESEFKLLSTEEEAEAKELLKEFER